MGASVLITAGKYGDVGSGNFVTQIYAKFHTLLHWRSTTKGVISERTYSSLHLTRFLFFLFPHIFQDVGNFGDLALAMVMLANVILKTEEIYLVNHIKLYLNNNPTAERRIQALMPSTGGARWLDEAPSTSSAAAAARAAASVCRSTISEINYFAKVLSEKLLSCLDTIMALDSRLSSAASHAYCQLAGRFVNALHNVCCRSRHKDALQSVFRLVLAESEFLCKYYSLLRMSVARRGVPGSLDAVLIACQRLALSVRLEEPIALLEQAAQLSVRRNLQRELLREVCRPNMVSTLKIRKFNLSLSNDNVGKTGVSLDVKTAYDMVNSEADICRTLHIAVNHNGSLVKAFGSNCRHPAVSSKPLHRLLTSSTVYSGA